MINYNNAPPTPDNNSFAPKRSPSLVERVMRLFTSADPTMGPQAQQQESTQSGTLGRTVVNQFDKVFKADQDRYAIYRDVDEMDNTSEEVSVVLDTIADNVCSSEDGSQETFSVVCDGTPRQLIENMLDRTNLHRRVYSITRNLCKYGDYFGEIIANGQGQNGLIADLKHLPPHTMVRNEDSFGNLALGRPRYENGRCVNKLGECAFQQIDQDTRQVIASFYPWQILHLRLNHEGFTPYGRSMLRVTRLIWRKLKAEEEALIIGRLTRAYLKLVYHIDATGLAKNQRIALLEEFKNAVTQRQSYDGRRENPYTVQTDIYLADGYVPTGSGNRQPSRTRVELIDPKNEGLSEIADIEFLHRKKLATLRIPPAHLGFEKDINAKATLTMQDVQYVRYLRRIQSLIGHGLEHMIDLELILQGLDPKGVDFQIKWPELSAANEAAASLAYYQRAQGDAIYLGNSTANATQVLDSQYLLRHRFQMTDTDIADMESRVAEEQAEIDQRNQANADAATQNQIDVVKAAPASPNGNGKRSAVRQESE